MQFLHAMGILFFFLIHNAMESNDAFHKAIILSFGLYDQIQ